MRKRLFIAALLLAAVFAFNATEARADDPEADSPQKRFEFALMPEKCPLCGSGRIAAILYGKPDLTAALQRELDEERIVLGGCEVTGNDPLWKCLDCGGAFYLQSNALNCGPKAPAPRAPESRPPAGGAS